ncbi:MAG: hypothetical protein Q9217_005782 [Psora testacea]
MGSPDALKRGGLGREGTISPPPKRHRTSRSPKARSARSSIAITQPVDESPRLEVRSVSTAAITTAIPSPVQLNFVSEFPASSNVDTISLGNILGDPLIKECWLFNYLFDVDFVMKQFDPDVRNLVQVKIVHGSWRKEDKNGSGVEEGAKRYPNIQVVKAYMPEAYGTHHSKMIILFRHDDLAQVIITTGNFIERDWRMSQAFWRSPLLPLQLQSENISSSIPRLGSGPRFKRDLLAYARSYGTKLVDLRARLQQYDFSQVRGALVASTPGKQYLQSLDRENETLWGLPGLKRILECIPSYSAPQTQIGMPGESLRIPHIVTQISSVASVGEKWLTSTFFSALSTATPQMDKPTATTHGKAPTPKYSIVFPTPSEIRNSIDGYGSGSSIHMKTQSPVQAKQLDFIRPMLCHWAPTIARPKSHPPNEVPTRKAGRHPAAPHIKTYIRFSDESMTTIDWAMMTSANLSTQAWGSAPNTMGEVRICSYEIGVVVWPGLWDEEGQEGQTKMVPVFKSDMPGEKEMGMIKGEEGEQGRAVVGWRMPYDLPLVPYRQAEVPWCATQACNEPDWMGRVWPGYGA